MNAPDHPTTTDPTADPVERAQDKAEDLKQDLNETAQASADTVQEKSSEMVAAAKDKLRQNADGAKKATLGKAEAQKEKIASSLTGYEKAAKAAVSKLKEENDDELAVHIETAASKIGDVSSYLKSHDIPELAEDLSRFTRKHPEIVLGATILVGFAAARFLKMSSAKEADRRRSNPHYAAVTSHPASEGFASDTVQGGDYSEITPGEDIHHG